MPGGHPQVAQPSSVVLPARTISDLVALLDAQRVDVALDAGICACPEQPDQDGRVRSGFNARRKDAADEYIRSGDELKAWWPEFRLAWMIVKPGGETEFGDLETGD